MQRFDEADALRRYKQGDAEARRQLIESYLPLARRLAARYRNSGESSEDLEQVASLGLIKAIDRYEPGAGCVRPLRGAHDRRRAQAPLSRQGLGNARAALSPGARDRGQ